MNEGLVLHVVFLPHLSHYTPNMLLMLSTIADVATALHQFEFSNAKVILNTCQLAGSNKNVQSQHPAAMCTFWTAKGAECPPPT